MKRADNVRPVVIRRKKVSGGDGHHGGAWKVAYADFVTAMMAFFLMLWLLGSVEEDKRKGIADYFSPTLSIASHSAGADGFLGGVSDSVMTIVDDTVATRGQSDLDITLLQQLARKVERLLQDTATAQGVSEQVKVSVTHDGLEVEVFELPGRPLFDPDTAYPGAILTVIAGLLVELADEVTNPVAVAGHLATRPVVVMDNPVWPLSMARAQAMQALLLGAGLTQRRLDRLEAHGDSKPVMDDPMAVQNNRIVVTFLRV